MAQHIRLYWVSQYRRALVLVAGVIAAGGMVLESVFLKESITTPTIWHGAGALAAIALGEVIRFWATLAIGGRKSKTVVSEGPYALTRNPLYVGNALGVIGVFVASASWFAGGAALLLMLIIYQATIQHEEAKLESYFGEDYTAYKARTPRFWPRLSNLGDAKIIRDDACPTRILWREAYTAFGFGIAAAGALALRFLLNSWLG